MKLFRAYIITVIVCISVSSTVACIFIADENARKISLGEEYTVVEINDSDAVSDENTVNPLPVLREIAEGIKKAASISPPPIGNIYWFMQKMTEN